MIDEYEKFGATIRKHPGGSHFITIPMNVVKFASWGEGDDIILMAKRIKKEVE
jgi:hypothetical protein